jgi:1-deoxy-D-xylulose-5-phosphate synthase
LQRAYDQVIHDAALQKLNVVFALDRAGLVGADGPTHHGCFDLAYLRAVPGLVVMAPMHEDELQHMIRTALDYDAGPIALRYPRGNGLGVKMASEPSSLAIGRAEILERGQEILLLGLGSGALLAQRTAALLSERGLRPTVVNARFLKPLDEELLLRMAPEHALVCTFEEGTTCGGFGSAVLELLHARLAEVPPVRIFGIPDRFVEHGSSDELLADVGLQPGTIAQEILEMWEHRDKRVELARHRRA